MKQLKMLGLCLVAVALAVMTTASAASATTLEVGGVAQNKSVSFTWTLKSGTSMPFLTTTGGAWETCTGLEVKGATEGSFTGTSVSGKFSSFTWSGCIEEVQTINPGRFQIAWSSGTNGTVTLSETEFLWNSALGPLTCKFAPASDIGLLTGVKEGQASMDLQVVMACGTISMRLSGTLTVTSPSGLGVVS